MKKLNKMQMLKVSIILLAYLGLTTSCPNQPKPDGQQTREDFFANIKSFPITASEQKQNQLKAAYPKLDLGMSKQEVIKQDKLTK